MTVKELRDKLARFDDQTNVAVYWEDDDKQTFFEIDDLSLTKGEPLRGKSGKPGFRFDGTGPASWLFINVSPDK